MTRLDLETGHRDGFYSVALYGELNLQTAGTLTRELLRLEEYKPPVIALDLQNLQFIDSTGLRIIVAADATARREGRKLLINPGPEAVQRVFRTTLLDQRLNFVEKTPPPENG